ncbi:hypothetical protein [Massiliimalia massiliensis]|uniref:hypothetical protein n=1 Tax=Massiliimalia massiliensis TaxID=1852384 RepID=UPI000986716F|nr:hypothetical protein [Massiliimalia massiliensis]
MKKHFLSVISALMILTLVLTGCGAATYQEVLDDYSSKIQDKAPTLVEEFQEEAADLDGDPNKLAELSEQKISELAEISTEGTAKMAEIKLKNNDEDSVYQEWAEKLTAIYEEEAAKITDAYMALATE